jgi:hypothetical protein
MTTDCEGVMISSCTGLQYEGLPIRIIIHGLGSNVNEWKVYTE